MGMTNTTPAEKVLKSDVLGRVKSPRARQEALLDEFERSGVSGKKFAALVGINTRRSRRGCKDGGGRTESILCGPSCEPSRR
jgi:hypothetical protein